MSSKKSKTIFAVGADIKNRFLIGKGEDLCFGPDIGDLRETYNYESFKKEMRAATKKIKPDIIAYDLHPNYFSTRLAKSQISDLKILGTQPIQHHHAHIASVMYEHNLKDPVIGVSFDGTGFGTDGNMWGGEFLMVDKSGFKRLAHFRYMKMPGGDKVVREPWRMVLSILGKKGISFIKSVKKEDKELVLSMISKNINAPFTSSVGRLFDASSALLGICQIASYEAEGPIKLEAICEDKVSESYEFGISKRNGRYIIDESPLFLAIIKDIKSGKSNSVIATKFHNSIVNIIIKIVRELSKDTSIKDVALSGGVFQNKFLKRKTIENLLFSKFNVFTNDKTPVNDFNIALGQYYVSCRTGRS